MLKKITKKQLKILFIILLSVLYFLSNNILNNKITNYRDLVMAKQKEIKLEQKYKKKYFKLKEKYKYEVFNKEEIINNLNLIIDRNNIEIINMKTTEKEENVLIDLKVKSSFNNINNFIYYLSLQKSFYDLNNILIKTDLNNRDKLLVKAEILFSLSAFIENNYYNTVPQKITDEIRNPYQIESHKTNYVLNQQEKEIVMNLPIELRGIIIGAKNKLAIIKINNKVKAIEPGFKNSEIKVVEINMDNIKVEYENLFFKINLGGNKGVIQ